MGSTGLPANLHRLADPPLRSESGRAVEAVVPSTSLHPLAEDTQEGGSSGQHNQDVKSLFEDPPVRYKPPKVSGAPGDLVST